MKRTDKLATNVNRKELVVRNTRDTQYMFSKIAVDVFILNFQVER